MMKKLYALFFGVFICAASLAQPIASVNPTSLSATINSCNDSVTVPLKIYNTGSSNLTENITFWGGQSPSTYCPPSYSNNDCSSGDWINNFTFNTISNLNSGCNNNSNNLIFYTTPTTTVSRGATYSMTMQSESSWSQGFGVWIDYNRNGSYADAGEFVYASPSASTAQYSTNVTIPTAASLGKTRMRVRCRYSSTMVAGDYCTSFVYGETEEYEITIGGSFVSASPASGNAAAGDSATVNVKFKSAGLNSGVYIDTLYVNSNDPVNPKIAVLCQLTVNGSPIMALTKSCMNYGSILVNATKKDSLYIKNTGCDTLKVTAIVTQTSEFTASVSSLQILPGDSGKVVVTFAPTSVGSKNDTLQITSNAGNQTACLAGTATPPPIISVSPASFNVTISSCNDSVILPMKIYNTGSVNLNWTIPGFTSTPIAASCTPTTTGYCCNMGIYNVTFNTINNNSANGSAGYQNFTGISTIIIPGKTYTLSVQTGNNYNEYVKAWIDYNNNGIFENSEQITFDLNSLPNQVHTTSVTIPTTAVQITALRMRVVSDYQFSAIPQACNNVQYGQFEDYTVQIGNWLSPSSQSGTVVPNDSATVNLKFKSTGLTTGQYTYSFSVNSNDPVNPLENIPCTLNVAGSPNIVFTKTCINYGSLMVGLSKKDSLYIKNTGCDTLKISNIINSLSVFTLNTASVINILPGDSAKLAATFAPAAVQVYNDTFHIFNNQKDTFVCLSGTGLPPPNISISPSSLTATINSCNDSLSLPLKIYNNGSANLDWTIPGFTSTPIAASCTPVTTGYCCNMGIYNVTFNTINNNSANGSAGYQNFTGISTIIIPGKTYTLSVQTGNSYNEYVKAWIDYNNNGVFENSEQIMFDLNSLPNQVHTTSVTIPATAVQITALRMRVVSDYQFSAIPQACNNVQYGQFEDYTVKIGNWLSPSSQSGTVIPNDSATVTFKFKSSGLNTGQYTYSVPINSNDPDQPTVNVPCTLNVVGNPIMTLSKTCINFPDSTMEFTTKKDSLYIKNTGCDTLKITNVTKQTNNFSVTPTSGNILPGDSVKAYVTFAPVSPGMFYDTLSSIGNVAVQTVCLSGKGFSRPIESHNPDTVAAILACSDTITDTLTIYNTGLNNLTYSFSADSGKCANFNGSSYIRKLSPVNLPTGSVMTVSAWIYPVSYPDGTYNGIVSWGPRGCTATSFLLSIQNSGRPSMATWCNDFVPGSGPVATLNQWNHIACVINGTSVTLYMNGTAVSGTISAPNVQSQNLAIGSTDFPGRYFNGKIDEVKIYNKALTAAEIQATRYKKLLGTESGLMGYFNFDNGTANDLSPAGNNGTLMGATISSPNAPVYPEWLSLTPTSATVATNDSSKVTAQFISTGLTIGQYYSNIIISSNDPLNNPDTAVMKLSVIGAGKIKLSKNCMYLDSIMENTTKKDSLYVKNSGCDTLKITGISNQTTIFSASPTAAFNLLPGDSSKVVVTFAPTSTGTFYDTLTIHTTVGDSLICLSGKGFPRPIISVSPTSFNVTLACVDSLTDTLTVHNIGANNLTYNIDTGNYCLALDGNGDFVNRNVVTLPTGGSQLTIEAWIYPTAYNDASYNGIVSWGARGCTGNGMLLSIQNNGRPSMATWCNDFVPGTGAAATLNQWNHIALVLNGTSVTLYMNGTPVSGTLSSSINFNSSNLAIGETDYNGRFFTGRIDEVRVWNTARSAAQITAYKNKKLYGNETGLVSYWNFDKQNANDKVSTGNNGTLNGNAAIIYNSPFKSYYKLNGTLAGSLVAGDSTKIAVNFNSTGLSVGTYIDSIAITSNDPLGSPTVVPATLNVVGAGKIKLTKSCMYLDSIMQFTTKKDSLYIKNVGCDTLKVTNITKQTSIFTVNATTFNILTGDSAKVVVTFAPTTVGTFYDTLTIHTNAGDSLVCLSGKSFQRPIISTNPTSVNVTLACVDSLTDTLLIHNTGGSNLNYSLIGPKTITYSQSFVTGQTPTTQATAWVNFRAQLTSHPYTQLKISGSNNTTGITLTDPTAIANIANAMNTLTNYSVVIAGNTWTVNINGCNPGVILTVNAPVCNCDGANPNLYLLRPEIGNANWGGINTVTCSGPSQTMTVEFTYTGTFFGTWLQASPLSGTVVPGDSSITTLKFNSTGLTVGQYTSNINISSNDPLKPVDSVLVTLNVVGAGKIKLSKNCMYLDSIMEYTTKKDSLYVKNIGCDTLKVIGIYNQTSKFSATPTSAFNLLPGDSAKVTVTFAPTSTGTFYDTLTIHTNAGDSLVCLSGKAFARPVVSTNPTSVSVTLVCCDSVTSPLKIYNTGGSPLIEQILSNQNFTEGFENGLGKWVTGGGSWTIVADPHTGTSSLKESPAGSYFNGMNQYIQLAQKLRVTDKASCTLSLWEKGFMECCCDHYYVQLSVNGGAFTTLLSESCSQGAWNQQTFSLTSYVNNGDSILVRFLFTSDGSVVSSGINIDDIVISGINTLPDWLTFSPVTTDTIAAGDSTLKNLYINSCGKTVGTYTHKLIVQSNDPLNPADTVLVTLQVNGAAHLAISDSCISFDTIMEYTATVDTTLRIANTGCDTLFVSATTSANFYIDSISLDSAGGYILPGDTIYPTLIFAPDSSGIFTGTLTLNSNDIDTVLCLKGYAYPRPIISVSPDTMNVNIEICQDSVIVPLVISNSGGSDLHSGLWSHAGRNVLLDGVNDNVDLGTWFNYQTFTIEMWVKPGSTQNQYADIIDNNHTGSRSWVLQQNSTSTNQYSWGTNDGGGSALFNLTANQWAHIAVTRDGNSKTNKVYINGTLFSTWVGTANIPYDGTQFFRLGRWGGGGRNWNGLMDEVRVINKALSQAEINSSMYNTLTGNENGLLAYWNFDDSTANDLTSNAHNGTLINGAAITAPNIQFLPSAINGTAPSVSSNISVVFYKAGLSPGTNNYVIDVSSNDPLNPLVVVPVIITVDTLPPTAPSASDTAICFGSSTPDLIANGDSIRWYSDGALTTNVHNGDTFTTAQTAVGTYTYYVTETDTATGCQSQADTVVLSINSPPAMPTASDTTVCSNSSIPNLTSTGTIVKWYSNSTLTTLVHTGTTFSTGNTAAGTYTYYVTDSVGGCSASAADTSVLTINNAATVGAGTDAIICSGSTYTLSGTRGGGATSSTWTTSGSGNYDDATLLAATYTPSGTDITNGSAILTITTNDPDGSGPCAAISDAMFLAINAAATVNAGADTSICGNSTYTLSGTKGGGASTITWTTTGTGTFNSSTSLTAIYTASAADISAGSVTLIITSNDPAGPCPAATDSMVLTLSSPATAGAGADATICSNEFYTLNGTRGGSASTSTWTTSGDGYFTDSSQLAAIYYPGTNDISNGSATLTITTNDPAGPCPAAADVMILTINSTPAKPNALDTVVCSSSSIPNLTCAGTIVKWYSDGALTNLVFTGTSFNTAQTNPGTYTYYVTDSTSGCTAGVADTSVLTINNAATASAGADTTICSGSTYTLSGTRGGGATSSTWTTSGNGTYNDATLLAATYTPSGTDISNGSASLTITTNDPDGSGPCVSVSDAMILTINPAAVVNAGADSTICGNVAYVLQGTKSGGASTITWTTSGTGTFNSSTSLTATYTASAADVSTGSVTLSITSNDPAGPCPAATDAMILTLNTPATVSAGADATICSNGFYTLNGTRGGSAATSTWTTSGDGYFTDSSLLAAVYYPGTNDISNGTVTLTITTDDPTGPCTSVSDAMILTINSTPAAPVSSDTTVCSDATIPNLTTSGTNIKWYSDAALTTLVGSGNSFNTGQTAPGSYKYWLTDSTSSCTASAADSATLTINEAATANAGANDTICEGSTLALAGNMGGSASSILWTTSGDGTFDNATSLTAIYTPGTNDIAGGSATLTITTDDPDGAGPCAAAVSAMSLKINPAATVNAGADATICQGSTHTLSGTMGGGASSITWTTSGSGTFSSSTSLTATYTPSASDISAGTVNLIITTNDPSGPCPAATDTMVLTINISATVSAGNDSTICSTQTIALSGTMGGSATSINWATSGDGTFDDATSLTAIYTPGATDISNGSATLTITTNDPDGAGPCSAVSDNMVLTINSTPAIPVSSDTTVCSDVTIPDLISSGTIIQWYSDAALTALVSTGDSLATGQTAPGSYEYFFTDSVTGCPASTADSATLTINEAATVSAGANDTICEGNTLTLSATMGGSASSTLWTTSGDGTFDDATLLNAVYTPGTNDISSGNVTLTITTNDPDAAGPCTSAVDAMSLAINPAAIVDAGANDTICGTSTKTLSGTMSGGASSITWTTSGSGTFNSSTSLTAIYTPSAGDITAGNITLYITSNDPAGPCPAVVDSMLLKVNTPATVSANADDTICSGNTFTTNGTRGGSAASSLWTTSGDGTFDDATLLAATYTPGATDLSNGTVTLTITTDDPSGPCPSVTDNMILKINSAPAAPVASDATICFGQTTPNLTASGTFVKWFSDGSLTNLLFTGTSFASGDAAVGTYTFYVTDSVTSCPASISDTSTLIINSLPSAPVASDTAICNGSVVPDLIAAGDSIRWYDNGTLTNLVANNDTFITGVSGVGVYVYYATQTDLITGCQGPSDTVILTINAVPSSPGTNNETICEETPTPDLVATGTNIQWYSDAGLTTIVFSGDSFASGDTAAGVYTYYVTQTANNCESPSSTAVLTIFGTPAAPAASDTTACQGSPNNPLIASGTNIQWFSDSTLSVPIFGGDTFFSSQTIPGAYSYWANQTINSCAGPGTKATLTIKPIPGAPVSADTAICIGSPVPNLNATGTNVKWYSDIALTNLVHTGNSFATGDTAAGSYTYYVTDSLNSCGHGPSTAVTLEIDTVPVPPNAVDASSCFGDSVPSLTANGLNITWYSDASLTTQVATGNSFATGDSVTGTFIYYATSSTPGCGESAADSATLTINALPSAPSTTDAANCFGSTTASLTASGTNITWYSDAALTVSVATGNSFVSNDSAAGTYTYYATQTDSATGCEGAADSAILTINALPSAPVSSDTTVLYGNPVPDLTATGTNVNWYSDSSLTTLVATGNTFTTNDSTVGSYTYYVTQFDSATSCESNATSVTLTILPGAPTTTSATACENGTIPNLAATGTNVKWYSDAGLTTLVFTGNSFPTLKTFAGTYTYFATQTINGVESPASSATLTINPLPAAPATSGAVACEGQTVPDLTAAGTSINWYSDSSLTNLLFNGNSFASGDSVAGTYTYYATETELGCEGASSTATLTIKANPPAPTAADSSTCYGNPVPDLFASGTNVSWYSDSALTSFDFAGNTFVTGDTAAGVYTYYAIDSVNGCTSAHTQVNLLISAPAVAPTSASTSVDPTCPGAATTLSVSGTLSVGTLWRWYSASCGGTSEGTGDSIVVSPLATTNYFVRAEGGCDTTSCVNVGVNVTNTLSAAATSASTSADSICPNTAATISVNGGSLGTAANWQWYTASCGGTSAGSGISLVVNPSSTTTYFVRAEGTCNTTVCDSVTVNINVPPAPAASSATICEGQPVPDLTASGTNVKWYSDSALTTMVFAGDSFATGKTTAGVYTYYVTETNSGGCQSGATVSTLTINAIPAAPAVSNATGCEGGIIPDLTTSGTFISWYNDSALTNFVAGGDTFATGQTVAGTYTYFVTDSVVGCVGPSSSATLTINTNPSSPATTDGSGCSGDSTIIVSASGNNVQWYSDAALTTMISSGDTLAPGLLPAGAYTYYATQTVNGCASAADSANLTVFATPAAPVSSSQTICQGTPTPDLIAAGTNINWYNDSLLANNVSSNDTFATGQVAAGVYVYYATETQNGCAGSATTVTLTINAIPAAPATSSKTACSSGVIPDLIANGTNVNWYSDSLLTINVSSNDTFATGQTTIGSYTYYATETVNGCASSSSAATLTIVPSPAVPNAADKSVCVGSAVPNLTVSSGNNIRWFSNATLTTQVGTGNSFATGKTAVGVYTYYVNDSLPGCVSAADSATLTINAIPPAPAASNVTVCSGLPVPNLTAAGSNIVWYKESMLILVAGVGNSLVTGKTQVGTYTYYATQTVNGCTSSATLVTLSINPNPLVTLNTYSTNITAGQSVTLIAYNAGIYNWTPSTGLNTTTNDTVIASPGATITYTVTGSNAFGCSSSASVTVNVFPLNIEEVANGSQSMSVYPNPTKGTFQLAIDNWQLVNGETELKIYNVLGEVVHNTRITNAFSEIDLSRKGSGVYYVQLISEKGVMTKRVVVE